MNMAKSSRKQKTIFGKILQKYVRPGFVENCQSANGKKNLAYI